MSRGSPYSPARTVSTGLRSVLDCAAARLAPGGWLVMEFGCGQDSDVTALLDGVSGLDLFKVRHDLQDIPRTVVCRKGFEAALGPRER